MQDKLEGMNEQFKEGYTVGVAIAQSSIANSGIEKARDICEKLSTNYRKEKSEEFVFGMDSGINTTINEALRRIYGPRESMRKVMRKW